MYLLSEDIIFPNPEEADTDGILAIGGDLSPERLLLAYRKGIFPWYSEGDPIIWWSPDPRFVLYPDELKIAKSMKKILRDKVFSFSYNQHFEEVIYHCKHKKRAGQQDTWITDEMEAAYIKLHKLGYAKSVEVWQEEKLVGGLYGVDLGHVFCGESMFSHESNASKAGFIYLIKEHCPLCQLIDCQVYTEHLASLGAKEIPREVFLKKIG